MTDDEVHRALPRLGQGSQGTRRADQFAEAKLGFGDFDYELAPSSRVQFAEVQEPTVTADPT
jgi:hypothetical protein